MNVTKAVTSVTWRHLHDIHAERREMQHKIKSRYIRQVMESDVRALFWREDICRSSVIQIRIRERVMSLQSTAAIQLYSERRHSTQVRERLLSLAEAHPERVKAYFDNLDESEIFADEHLLRLAKAINYMQ